MADYREFYEKSMKALTAYIENNKEMPGIWQLIKYKIDISIESA